MWCQEVNQYQGHDEHVHHYSDQISGIYLVDCPDTGSKLAIHDPRAGKLQINLPEKDRAVVTQASPTAVLTAAPGRFYFFNSWTPHSVTRNLGTDVTRLVHFNLTVGPAPKTSAIIV